MSDRISLDLVPDEQWWTATPIGVQLTSRIYLRHIQEDERGYYIALNDLTIHDADALLTLAKEEHALQLAEKEAEKHLTNQTAKIMAKDTD